MKLYNNFSSGRMDKDIEVRLLQKGSYLDARNVRIATPDGPNSRSAKFPLGNTQITSLDMGDNPECLGACVDNFRDRVYWSVVSDSGCYVVEYDTWTDTAEFVLTDLRSGANNLLGFERGRLVQMRVLNDNDNGKNFLFLTDGRTEPKFFEIGLAKSLGSSVFVFEDISLIKAPPTLAPTITLGQTASGEENNLENKFLSFAYRYKYQNDEWSALSPFSEFAFMPDSFQYDYKEGTNTSMFNNFSKVIIGMSTGSSNVKELQLVVKESRSNTAYVVQTFNKADEGWADNGPATTEFDNSKVYKALDSNQLLRVYDNVPLAADAIELIGNRPAFANYLDGYDLTYQGNPINLQMSLGYGFTQSGFAGTPHRTVKTNRDYEIAIAYEDGKGRLTTPLVSEGNTVFVPYSVANNEVRLELTIDKDSRPPDWATGFRLYLKQSKTDYDVIAPITFYRDGIYAWIKLEGNDVQKVSEGDFLYVKSDTSGLKQETIRTKVLQIETQPENFLEDTYPDPYEELQEAGVYMRLKVDNYALSSEAVSIEEWIGFSFRSDRTSNNIDGSVTYVEPIFFDGTGRNDLTQGGALTGNADIRFEVEIVTESGTDEFRWRSWDVTNDDAPGPWSADTPIPGGAFAMSNGIEITFATPNGHTAGDRWFISCKAAGRENDWDESNASGTSGTAARRAIVLLQGKDPDTTEGEGIAPGAQITITYDDSASGSRVDNKQGLQTYSLISTRAYPNLEEWFYGDNVISQVPGLVWDDDINNVLFRRGTLDKANGEQMTVTGSATDRLYMAFLSPCNYRGNDDNQVEIDNSLIITEFDNPILFETVPEDITSDIFYELPYRYNVTAGNHGGSTPQIFGVRDATIVLPFFNAFGWFNGFESYKVGDTFNQKAMVLDTKPLVPVDNYQQIKRVAGITWGGVYEATTQFNAVNEFNLATVNYADLDIRYGPIRRLHSRDTNLYVFQHDKTSYMLFNKDIILNADGTGNISQSNQVLGDQVAIAGEYGICNHPESFAFFGNRIYHYDPDRGVLMRLSLDGYTEVSANGMVDYFRTLPGRDWAPGAYDPYNDEYLLNVGDDLMLAFKEGVGFTSFYEYQPEYMVGLNNRLYSFKGGQLWVHDSNGTRNNFYGVQRTLDITTVINDAPGDSKHFKALNLESDIPFDVELSTARLSSTIDADEFENKEGEYYAYIRQAESTTTQDILTSVSAYRGGGSISSIAGTTLTMDGDLPRSIRVGDTILLDNTDDTLTPIGEVTGIDRTAGTITLDTVVGLSGGDFILYGKVPRIEGEPMRGQYMKIRLLSDQAEDKEIFALSTQVARSSD